MRRQIISASLLLLCLGLLKTFQKPTQSIAAMMRQLARRPRQVLDYVRLTANSAETRRNRP